ncbi:MAG: gliding motility-associated C-terminal domain-containing protein, partial [Bacteroidia bacterium]
LFSVSATITEPTALVPSILNQINVDCNGNSTGSVDILASGGTMPYQYSIDGTTFSPNASFGGLAAGNYTITIRDANNCLQTQAVFITQPTVLSLNLISQTNVDCNGNSTGSVTLTGAGGTAPYQYSSDGVNFTANATFASLSAGAYTFTVRDDSLCTASLNVSITEPNILGAVIANQINVDCNGNSTGSISLTPNGGTSPYQYSIDGTNFQTSNQFTGLAVGTYSFSVRDANNCLFSLNATITEPTVLSATLANQTNVDCFGASTGSAELSATGGTSPYQYSSNGVNFGNSPILTGLSAGTYSLSVRDANNCLFSLSVTITEPPVLTTSILSQNNVDCNGNSTGIVNIGAVGGTPPYQYAINGAAFGPNPTFTNLAAGNYSISVRDANNCLQTQAVMITEPSVLSLNLVSQTNVDCNGNSVGATAVSGQGGTVPYQYSIDGINFGNANTFGGLAAGTYTLSVRDDSSCLATLNVTITEPTPLSASIANQTNVDCNGNSTGSVSLTPNGGTNPYQYSIDGINFSTSNQFNNLAAGTYNLSVRDANNCLFSLGATITEPNILGGDFSNIINVDCFGSSNGSLTISGTGGTAAYTYALNGGAPQTNGTFSNLFAGVYTLTITDGQACVATRDTSIVTPTGLTGGIDSVVNLLCNGAGTGSAAAFATGGAAPYTYSLDGVNFQNSPSFTGLAAGADTITVRDNNACIFRIPFVLTEPNPLQVQVLQNNGVLCFGDSTATLILGGIGGIGSYQYQINGQGYQTSGTFSQLPAGNYTLEIQDQNLCVNSLNVVVSEPPLLSLGIDSRQDVACFGGSSGAFSVSSTGGSGAYLYALNGGPFTTQTNFSGLSAGFYYVFVEDANNCQDSLSITITEPTVLTASIDAQKDVTCFGESNGWVRILPQGGTPNYQYSLDGITYQASNQITGLNAGNYTIRIQDDSACVFNLPVQINQPTQLGSSILVQKDVDCFGNSTGAVTLSGTGGITPYLYDFNAAGLQSGNSFTGLVAGSYTVIIQDDSLCRDTSSVLIIEPTVLSLAVDTVIDVACFGDSTGSVQLLTTGGSAAYRYNLSNGDTANTPQFTGLPAANYTATVTDDSSCVASISFVVNEPPLLLGSIAYQQNVDCNGNATGDVGILASGGTPPYQYAINGGTFSTDSNFVGLIAGAYIVEIQDQLGCSFLVNVSITEPAPLVPSINSLLNIDCFGNATGEADILASGGTPPYEFSIDSLNFQTSGVFTGLLAGPHRVWVRDDSSCIRSIDFQLTQPDTLVITLDSLVNVDCNGNATAYIKASSLGGSIPYLYSLDGSVLQSSGRFENLRAGNYQLVVIDAQGCSDTMQIQITEPAVLSLTTSNTDVICYSEATGTASVVPQGGTPPYQIQWDNGQDSLTAINLIAGVYEVSVTDGQGCETQAFQAVGQPDTLILSLVQKEDAFCSWENGSVTVAASGGITSVYQYDWNTNPAQFQAAITDIGTGTYIAMATDQNACTDTLSVFIGDTPPAIPDFITIPSLADSILLSEANIQFNNLSTGAVSYEWEFGDGNASVLPNPKHSYLETGVYTIKLTAYNAFFVCPTTIEKEIHIIPDGIVYIPTAFSPNDDGQNDAFLVKGEGIVSLSVVIYNRWGRQVGRLNAPGDRWDGRLADGSAAPEGVYTFSAQAIFNSGKILKRGGTVTLIR